MLVTRQLAESFGGLTLCTQVAKTISVLGLLNREALKEAVEQMVVKGSSVSETSVSYSSSLLFLLHLLLDVMQQQQQKQWLSSVSDQ